MPLRARISAWFCLLSLPAIAAAGAFPGKAIPAKRAAGPDTLVIPGLAKADVAGFWSLDVEIGLDLSVKLENFFGSDGSWEGRGEMIQDGLSQTIHGFGTWTIRNDIIIVKTDPDRCASQGEEFADCADTASSLLIIRFTGASKTLVDITDGDEADVGEFVGAQKKFTLPDLISTSIFGARGDGTAPAPRLSVIGAGAGIRDRMGGGFDIRGRKSIRLGAAAGVRVSAPETR
jgi:hypothetical protein